MGNKVSLIMGVKSSHVLRKRKHIQSNIKQAILNKISCMLGPHQSPNWFRMSWFYEFHCLELWSLFMLIESWENQENGWKSKKIVRMHAKRKNGCKRLLKSGFYCLKKVWRWFSKIRVIWMKTILKTQFKTRKIMRKTRGVRREESSVHRTGHGEWGLGVWLWLHCWWL